MRPAMKAAVALLLMLCVEGTLAGVGAARVVAAESNMLELDPEPAARPASPDAGSRTNSAGGGPHNDIMSTPLGVWARQHGQLGQDALAAALNATAEAQPHNLSAWGSCFPVGLGNCFCMPSGNGCDPNCTKCAAHAPAEAAPSDGMEARVHALEMMLTKEESVITELRQQQHQQTGHGRHHHHSGRLRAVGNTTKGTSSNTIHHRVHQRHHNRHNAHVHLPESLQQALLHLNTAARVSNSSNDSNTTVVTMDCGKGQYFDENKTQCLPRAARLGANEGEYSGIWMSLYPNFMEGNFLLFGPSTSFSTNTVATKWISALTLIWSTTALCFVYLLMASEFRIRKAFPSWKATSPYSRHALIMMVIMVGIFSRLFKLFLSLDGLSIKQRWTIAMDVLLIVPTTLIFSFIGIKYSEYIVLWSTNKMQNEYEENLSDLAGVPRVLRNHVITGMQKYLGKYWILLQSPGAGPMHLSKELKASRFGKGKGLKKGDPLVYVDDALVKAKDDGDAVKTFGRMVGYVQTATYYVFSVLFLPFGGIKDPQPPTKKDRPTRVENGTLVADYDLEAPLWAAWLAKDNATVIVGELIGVLTSNKALAAEAADFSEEEVVEKAAIMSVVGRVAVLEKDAQNGCLSMRQYLSAAIVPPLMAFVLISLITFLIVRLLGMTDCDLDPKIWYCCRSDYVTDHTREACEKKKAKGARKAAKGAKAAAAAEVVINQGSDSGTAGARSSGISSGGAEEVADDVEEGGEERHASSYVLAAARHSLLQVVSKIDGEDDEKDVASHHRGAIVIGDGFGTPIVELAGKQMLNPTDNSIRPTGTSATVVISAGVDDELSSESSSDDPYSDSYDDPMGVLDGDDGGDEMMDEGGEE